MIKSIIFWSICTLVVCVSNERINLRTSNIFFSYNGLLNILSHFILNFQALIIYKIQNTLPQNESKDD